MEGLSFNSLLLLCCVTLGSSHNLSESTTTPSLSCRLSLSLQIVCLCGCYGTWTVHFKSTPKLGIWLASQELLSVALIAAGRPFPGTYCNVLNRLNRMATLSTGTKTYICWRFPAPETAPQLLLFPQQPWEVAQIMSL